MFIELKDISGARHIFFLLFVASTIHPKPLILNSTSSSTLWKRSIVFPRDEVAAHRGHSHVSKPYCRGHKTFCEEVDNYPEQLITSVLEKSDLNLISYNHSFLSALRIIRPFQTDGLEEAKEISSCVSKEEIFFPKVAKSIENNYEYIPNISRFRQILTIEKCLYPNQPCSDLLSAPLGYSSICRQKYVIKQLISLTLDGEAKLMPNAFRIPSCCVCRLTVLSQASKLISSVSHKSVQNIRKQF